MEICVKDESFVLGCVGDVRGEKTGKKGQLGHTGEKRTEKEYLNAKLSWNPFCKGELLKSFELYSSPLFG